MRYRVTIGPIMGDLAIAGFTVEAESTWEALAAATSQLRAMPDWLPGFEIKSMTKITRQEVGEMRTGIAAAEMMLRAKGVECAVFNGGGGVMLLSLWLDEDGERAMYADNHSGDFESVAVFYYDGPLAEGREIWRSREGATFEDPAVIEMLARIAGWQSRSDARSAAGILGVPYARIDFLDGEVVAVCPLCGAFMAADPAAYLSTDEDELPGDPGDLFKSASAIYAVHYLAVHEVHVNEDGSER